MEGLLENLTNWHWFILAVILFVMEVFAPGAVFMWIAIAAAIMGLLLSLFSGITWEYQLFIFAILSVASLFAWRHFASKNKVETDHPQLNKRGMQYVGRTFTLDEPIVNKRGRIRVDDTTWKIEGEDCDVGETVKVIKVEGAVLLVEKQ